MENEIISYLEMCHREGVSLQQGMNYRLGGDYSVILMSTRPNAPYRDEILDDGSTLIYEGHNIPRTDISIDPKEVDQPQFTKRGNLTQNGRFYKAAQESKDGLRSPEIVRAYEKIKPGIWSYNGQFEMIDAWIERDDKRDVFKFELVAIEDDESRPSVLHDQPVRRRIIPTRVKLVVWKRDKGMCVICGAKDELHFDHIIPFSKGGTSLTAENIQLLCARHNIEKRDEIK